ncbi:F-box/kelch-repeat protein At3g06240 [Lactuca sativa]|uniref:F-box/kelch-repeat protein At3g06240 n=1 Tax=Lactuca sativa TaxID=4236 RepID=UPI001C68C24B|nr:F-box/kelch-repeat protein At3g06240 [Lactuca sativa]
MATASDGRAPYESRGDGEKSRKRPFRPELNEEPQNVSQEGGQNNLAGNRASTSVIIGTSELEQMLNQMTFTSSEIQRLTALLHSRACDNVVVERDVPMTRMASPQQTTSIENLSGDLLSKIFILLMAKQLAQMRCVSKSWNAILSQSSFIKSHLHHSINNNDQILVVFVNNLSINHKLFTSYLYPTHSPHRVLANFIKIPRVKPGYTYRMIKIIGSVHGLICSSYGDYVIHIWNPSLRAESALPPYSFPYCGCYEISFRFGFDSKTLDYKVVKITGLTGPEQTSTSEEEEEEDDVPSFRYLIIKWLQVEIYSMRTGSWKLITQRFPSHITRIFDNDKACVDGHDGRLHWVGHTNEKLDSEVIVAFDLGSETFLEMTFPDSILDYYRSNTLGVLGGKLCVMSGDGDAEIQVWVAESWVKRHVFHFSHDPDHAFNGFTSHNEFFIEDADDCLVFYDHIADKAKILEKYPGGKCNTNRIVEYVDSLVWIAPPP